MAVFKCKMCGGTLNIIDGQTVCECEYCGSTQTVPRLDTERKANLFDRANHFRRNNEFDKATGIYEQILNEDTSDAEAYWSLVLCKYGIEYVEDPATHKRVPTVNRAQFTSVFDDDNYRSALEHASPDQRLVYEQEAEMINEIQKGILAISQKEEPFDVFICYKETDANGRRTADSVLANDLYHQLTQEGFKVFFSRITLEDKLGTAYEPYIFAALNSAKVMVVLGTRPEYFNAVWVKNEWSRYLSLVKQSGGKKVLIPAYRDMDPYDLPEEFSHLQAQDMSKLGFMQDLIRGIKKIASVEQVKTVNQESAIIQSAPSTNVAPLLKRAFMFLEDGEWTRADDFCEQVLNIEPENAQAYLGKLMAELHVPKAEDLPNQAQPFEKSNNYQRLIRYADETLVSKLNGYITHIKERNENARKQEIYEKNKRILESSKVESELLRASTELLSIKGYKDAEALYERCIERAEECRNDKIYFKAISMVAGGAELTTYQEAIDALKLIPNWKDSSTKIAEFEQRIEKTVEERKARAEAEKKAALEKKRRNKIAALCILTSTIVILVGLAIWFKVYKPQNDYNSAMVLYENGKYKESIDILRRLGAYKDSLDVVKNYYEEQFKNARVGSVIQFGYYNQGNGSEPIEWLVLDRQDNQILVISKYALDYQKFDGSTWADCSLRKWLNGSFMRNAFTISERMMILPNVVKAEKNKDSDIDPGKDTEDQVFVLSINEAQKYFSNDSRKCKATEYASSSWGAYKGQSGYCTWWLRSPASSQYYIAATVDESGRVSDIGRPINGKEYVRPALWINLNP